VRSCVVADELVEEHLLGVAQDTEVALVGLRGVEGGVGLDGTSVLTLSALVGVRCVDRDFVDVTVFSTLLHLQQFVNLELI